MKKTFKCFSCGNCMEEKQTSIEYFVGEYKVTISGVKGYVCETCGAKMFSPEEMELAEKLTETFANSKIAEKPEFLNVSETADLLRVSNQTIYNMIREGRLKATKFGREWRFLRKSIESLMDGPEALAARNAADKVNDSDRSIIDGVLEDMKGEN